MSKLSGSDYVAAVRLTNKRGDVLAMPGEPCTKVPEVSLGWLAESGRIKRRERSTEQTRGGGRFGRRSSTTADREEG